MIISNKQTLSDLDSIKDFLTKNTLYDLMTKNNSVRNLTAGQSSHLHFKAGRTGEHLLRGVREQVPHLRLRQNRDHRDLPPHGLHQPSP